MMVRDIYRRFKGKKARPPWQRRKVKYTFRVPNYEYIDWMEIDREAARDGISVFVVQIGKSGNVVLAVSRDFLTRYEGITEKTIDAEHETLFLAAMTVSRNWGYSLPEFVRLIDSKITEEEWAEIQLRGSYYRYIQIRAERIGKIKDDIAQLRAVKLPSIEIQVAEL